MGDWQPIETAPRDGTRVLLAWGGAVVVGFYLDNSKTEHSWAGWRVPSMEATPRGLIAGWMPMPEGPQ